MAKTTPSATYDDVNLVLHLYEMRREERMRQARAWFASSFHPKTFADIAKIAPPGSDDNASMRMVTSYWEMVACFITSGVLNEELFFQSGRELLMVWVRMEPILEELRKEFKDPFAYTSLEKVARSFAAWLNNRAPGSYDAFADRMRRL